MLKRKRKEKFSAPIVDMTALQLEGFLSGHFYTPLEIADPHEKLAHVWFSEGDGMIWYREESGWNNAGIVVDRRRKLIGVVSSDNPPVFRRDREEDIDAAVPAMRALNHLVHAAVEALESEADEWEWEVVDLDLSWVNTNFIQKTHLDGAMIEHANAYDERKVEEQEMISERLREERESSPLFADFDPEAGF